MAFCKKCGAPIADDAAFCPKCGAPVVVPVNFTAEPIQMNMNQPARRPMHVGMLVWSILTALASPLLGIAAIVMTVMATSAPSDLDEAKKIKIARVLNIIGLVLFVLTVIVTAVMTYHALQSGTDIRDVPGNSVVI